MLKSSLSDIQQVFINNCFKKDKIQLEQKMFEGVKGRVYGTIVSRKFENLDLIEREALVGDWLDDSDIDHAYIGIINFLTPEESVGVSKIK